MSNSSLQVAIIMGSDSDLPVVEASFSILESFGVKYTMGQMTAAYQHTKVDYAGTSTKDQTASHYGVSVAVNDSFSVSAGQQNVEFDGAAEDEKNSGIGASYTMGSISMYGGFNKLENVGGSATAGDVEASIFNISFAF